MATIRELQSKIDVLEKGLKSKATKPALKVKMRDQVSELKKKIKVLEKASDRGLDDVARAKRLAKKRRSEQALSLKDKDIESDANRYAINKTKRRSQGGRANQYGTKAENKGGIYYEKRDNRFDRQNKRYAKLEDGGYMEKGGYVAVSEKDGYWFIMSKPTTKNDAENMINSGMIPRGEVGKVVTLEEAKAHKKVIGKEYLADDYETERFLIIEDTEGTYEKGYYGVFDTRYNALINLFKLKSEAQGFLNEIKEKGLGFSNVAATKYNGKIQNYGDVNPKGGGFKGKLADGGMMAKGGKIKNQYEGRTASEVWEMWSEKQKSHFLLDHSELLDKDRMENNLGYSRIVQKDMSYSDLTPMTKRVLQAHIQDGQYADGGAIQTINGTEFSTEDLSGMFANGGETHRREDGMYAQGGAIEHGLKVGDEITHAPSYSTSISVRNNGERFNVDLMSGRRNKING